MRQAAATKKSKSEKSGTEKKRSSSPAKQNGKVNHNLVKVESRVTAMSIHKSPVSALQAKRTQTKIIVKCNCGFPNNLFIRGEGVAELTWGKGSPLKNTKPDEWVWETDKPFVRGQFKILINDKQYELGDNHIIECGALCTLSPRF